jgi:hypothetical protein
MGAAPMGKPGWPLFAAWTASIDNPRMVLMQSSSSEVMVEGTERCYLRPKA